RLVVINRNSWSRSSRAPRLARGAAIRTNIWIYSQSWETIWVFRCGAKILSIFSSILLTNEKRGSRRLKFNERLRICLQIRRRRSVGRKITSERLRRREIQLSKNAQLKKAREGQQELSGSS